MLRHQILYRLGLFLAASAAVIIGCQSLTEDQPLGIAPFSWQDAPVYVPADGTSELELVVTAVTAEGQKVQNIGVTFTTTAGTLKQATVVTNAQGEAATALIAPTSTVDVTATVSASISDTSGYILNPRTGTESEILTAPPGTVAIVSAGPITDEELDARLHAVLMDRARQSAQERRRGMSTVLGEPSGGEAAGRQASQADQLTVVFEGVLITLATSKTPITADGSSETEISARIRTTRGTNLIGRPVDFTAVHGKINPVITTDQYGQAKATLTSVITTAATDTVRAYLTPALFQSLVQGYVQPELTVSAERNVLPATGDQQSSIVARLLGPDGSPVVEERVIFAIRDPSPEGATLSPVNNGRTSANGEAVATLRAGQTAGNAVIDVSFSTLTASTTVQISDLNLDLRSERSSLVADGVSTTTIEVLVTDSITNTAVPSTQVQFETTLGNISATGTTNNEGRATATLRASTTSGTATVTVRQGPRSESIPIVMQPRDLLISVQPSVDTGLLRDGTDKTDITVLVQDPAGQPVNNLAVTWATTAGNLFPASGTTGVAGNAAGSHKATLTADIGSPDVVATVTVTVGDSVRTTDIPFRGISLTSTASTDTILANGNETATLTWQALETTSGAGIPNRAINISRVSGPSVVLGPVPNATDASGRASVAVSGQNAGDLVMQASIAGIARQQGLHLLQDQYTLTLSTDQPFLLRDGQDRATLTVEVVDRFGDPVVDANVSTALVGIGSITRPARTNQAGTTTFVLTADVDSTNATARIIAAVSTAADTIDIPLFGVRISIKANPVTLLADGIEESEITVTVKEAGSNTPLVGRTVNFAFAPGTFATIDALGTTDGNGQAIARLRADTTDAVTGTVTARVGTDPATLLKASTQVEIIPRALSLRFTSESGLRILRNRLDRITLEVEVTDNLGKAISSVDVAWATGAGTPAGVTLSRTTSRTNISGIATVDITGDAGKSDAVATILGTIGTEVDSVAIDLVGLSLSAAAQPTTITANSVDQATITGTLRETVTGNTLAGQEIRFSTSLGAISGQAQTDATGRATATLSADTSGTAKVMVRNGSLADSVMVTVRAPVASSVALEAAPANLRVKGTGGIETATITARVLDSNNEPVPPGVAVRFALSPAGAGTFAGTAEVDTVETDGDGLARIEFQSGTLATDVTITARVLGTTAESSTPLLTVVAGPTANITMSATPITFGADGLYLRELSAVLSDQYGNAVDSTPVVWTATPDTVGSMVGTSSTNENGVAKSSFTYGRGNEPAAVTYSATNQGITGTLAVPIGSLTATSEDASLLRDELATTGITATLRDGYGTPIDLTGIGFEVTAGTGTLSAAAAGTDAQGQAGVTYRGDAGAVDGSATIQARFRYLTATTTVALRGVTLTASASPDTISANGKATTTVTAVLKETTSNVALGSRNVSFSTTSLATIGGGGVTDNSGQASTTLTAGTTAGTASVEAIYGGLTAATSVVLSASAQASITLSASVADLQVQGTGGIEQSEVTVTVYDASGATVPAGQSVNLSVTDGTFSNGADTYTRLTDSQGRAVFTYTSGTTSGTKVFTATSGTATGSAALVTVAAGPPVQILLGYSPTAVDLGNGFASLTVAALVSDIHGNTVQEGTQLFFDIIANPERGAITPRATTEEGLAEVELTYILSEVGNTVEVQAATGNGTVATIVITLIAP